MSYMISAWARICKILGPGFAPYLPLVMGPILKTASMKPEVALLDNDELNGVGQDSDDWQFVSLGEQQNFGIKTSGLEDKATACTMLVCYARELKEHFVDYAEETVRLMVRDFKLQYSRLYFCTHNFCPKWKIFTFSRAHPHALTIATRRHEYFRGLSRLLPVPGVWVSFLELRFLAPYGFGRAPSASQKTLSIGTNLLRK